MPFRVRDRVTHLTGVTRWGGGPRKPRNEWTTRNDQYWDALRDPVFDCGYCLQRGGRGHPCSQKSCTVCNFFV